MAKDRNKPGKAQRAAGFFAKRGGIKTAFETTRRGADLVIELADRLKPRYFDKRGLHGRYNDGGIERFHELTAGMSDAQLARQYRGWLLQRTCFQYAALGAVLAIPIGIVFFQISKYLVVGLVGLFLFALFRAIRADFFAWILEQGRFGGFLDYLGSRLPRNVQIILPEQHRQETPTKGRGNDDDVQ